MAVSIDVLPKCLTSFVFVNDKTVKDSEFLRRLFGGLKCLTWHSLPTGDPEKIAFLSHCRNLRRLVLFHDSPMDFSFLRCMPHLKELAVYSVGCRNEDITVISREAPNLVSFAIQIPDNLSVDGLRVFFEHIGHEIRSVKSLMLFGTTRKFDQFLHMFSSDQSLFSQATSVRFLEDQEQSDMFNGELNLSSESRPQCTLFQIPDPDFADPFFMCCMCLEKRTSRWTCPRCECFALTD